MMNCIALFIFVMHFLCLTSADETIGCGGFLKSHVPNVPIDFSKVEVKLVTKQGIVKRKTVAAPNNGYFFIPIHDKGEMILQLSPPLGWNFEPGQVVLSIDGATDLCIQGEYINFVFQGFVVTGNVFDLGSSSFVLNIDIDV